MERCCYLLRSGTLLDAWMLKVRTVTKKRRNNAKNWKCILVDLTKISEILKNQQEVQYLCYFLHLDDRTGVLTAHLSSVDISKKMKFKDENTCITKLIDVLFELKKLERWSLLRQEREKKK